MKNIFIIGHKGRIKHEESSNSMELEGYKIFMINMEEKLKITADQIKNKNLITEHKDKIVVDEIIKEINSLNNQNPNYIIFYHSSNSLRFTHRESIDKLVSCYPGRIFPYGNGPESGHPIYQIIKGSGYLKDFNQSQLDTLFDCIQNSIQIT